MVVVRDVICHSASGLFGVVFFTVSHVGEIADSNSFGPKSHLKEDRFFRNAAASRFAISGQWIAALVTFVRGMVESVNESDIPIEEFKTGLIYLSKSEVSLINRKANERYWNSRGQGLKEEKHGRDSGNPSWRDVIGCRGEYALAKLNDRKCPFHLNTFHNVPDVCGWECRCRSEIHYDNIIRDKEAGSSKTDPEGKYALLVCISIPYVVFCVGWITKREVMEHPMRAQWIDDKGDRGEPAFFVPQRFHNTLHIPNGKDILKGREMAKVIENDLCPGWSRGCDELVAEYK